MTVLVLVHGWGLDASMWAPLQAALPEVETVALDLGFTGRPHQPPLPEGRRLIGVGHSLGFCWLLRQRPVWSALVSIGGFPRFTRSDDFPHGTHPRLLERMRSKLVQAPLEVHRDFLKRCGSEVPDRPLDVAALAAGLDWLAAWDERPALAGWPKPLLALAAADDVIVSEAMARQVFPAESLRLRADGGHLLPLSQPEWCAGQIRELLAELP